MDIYQQLEFILGAKKNYYILMKTEYNIQQLRPIVKRYGKTDFLKLMQPVPVGTTKNKSDNFYGCYECENCGKFTQKKYSKSRYIIEISESHALHCQDCETEKEKAKVVEIAPIRTKESYTSEFMDYLDCDKKWTKLDKNCIDTMLYIYYKCDTQAIYEILKSMNYLDFLKTPYWAAISYFVKYKAKFKCALCNSNQGLETHHKTYENHGREIENLNDLTCLCKNCHSKHHSK